MFNLNNKKLIALLLLVGFFLSIYYFLVFFSNYNSSISIVKKRSGEIVRNYTTNLIVSSDLDLQGYVVRANPPHACWRLSNPQKMDFSPDQILLIDLSSTGSNNEKSDCDLSQKILMASNANYELVIIYGLYDNKMANLESYAKDKGILYLSILRPVDAEEILEKYIYPDKIRFMVQIQTIRKKQKTEKNSTSNSEESFEFYWGGMGCLLLVIYEGFVRLCRRIKRTYLRIYFYFVPNRYDQEICIICFEDLDFENRETRIKTICCGHCFHENCINKWFTKKPICPMCQVPNDENYTPPIEANQGFQNFRERLVEMHGERLADLLILHHLEQQIQNQNQNQNQNNNEG